MDSTRLDDLAEISIIENPTVQPKSKPIAFEKPAKNTPRLKPPQVKTPRSKAKTPSSVNMRDIEPSPSVLTKKKPSPKSIKKKIDNGINISEESSVRPKRNVQRKRIFDSDEEDSDKENDHESDWSGDSSNSDPNFMTDDDSDHSFEIPKPKSVRQNGSASSTSKRPARKNDKNGLVYLDLSSEEVVRVDKNFHANVSEEDLANISRKFLDSDLDNEE